MGVVVVASGSSPSAYIRGLIRRSRYITGIPAHTHTICHVIIFRDNKLTQNCRSITCARLEYNKLPPYPISRIISYHKIVFLRLSTACSLALLRSGHGSLSAPIAAAWPQQARVSTSAHGSPTHVAMSIHSLCARKYVSALARLRTYALVHGLRAYVLTRLSTACSLALLRSGHGSIARPGRSKPEFRRLPMAHPLTLQCPSIACARVST